jgi:myosin-crossreactive antigen
VGKQKSLWKNIIKQSENYANPCPKKKHYGEENSYSNTMFPEDAATINHK